MRKQTPLISTMHVRAFVRALDPDIRLTTGFLRYLDLHLEAVLKRALVQKPRRKYLDAPMALVACRYPYEVAASRMDYQP